MTSKPIGGASNRTAKRLPTHHAKYLPPLVVGLKIDIMTRNPAIGTPTKRTAQSPAQDRKPSILTSP
jgi:hypothetical protein